MNPSVFALTAGIIAICWGALIATKHVWAAGWGKKMQSIYGRRAADQVTPELVRTIGIVQICMGALFIVLALTGALPNE